MEKKIVIIGSGASGLMTAVSILHHHGFQDMVLLNGPSKIGAKILISGGGKCNITNADLKYDNFFGESPNSIKKVILQFPPEKVIQFFEQDGLKFKVEPEWNKYFPSNGSSISVLEVLLKLLEKFSIPVLNFNKANNFFYKNGFWYVETEKKTYRSEKLVVACGGLSYPQIGRASCRERV